MKLIELHSKPALVSYKNYPLSLASLITFCLLLIAALLPVVFISLCKPSSAFPGGSLTFREQPAVTFQRKFLFVGDTGDGNIISCSTFSYLNQLTRNQHHCDGMKYFQNNIGHKRIVQLNFQLKLSLEDESRLKGFFVVLFLEAVLEQKCILKPPALIVQQVDLTTGIPSSADIYINSKLKLVQNKDFYCPYLGRQIKSHFPTEFLIFNGSSASAFLPENLKEYIEKNSAYFTTDVERVYFEKRMGGSTRLNFNIRISEVSSTYQMNLWENIGVFWLYYISFFGVSYYFVNKIKQFIFARHILRAYQVIPWKKVC